LSFVRPEHAVIADALRRMNHRLLLDTRCWFGGGTAIVLRHGEYRRSLDVDFLCSDADGYRVLRNAFVADGPSALFARDVRSVRDVRTDQYGIRAFLEHRGQPIKFEIVRERVSRSTARWNRSSVCRRWSCATCLPRSCWPIPIAAWTARRPIATR
jgi:hypothetical protein